MGWEPIFGWGLGVGGVAAQNHLAVLPSSLGALSKLVRLNLHRNSERGGDGFVLEGSDRCVVGWCRRAHHSAFLCGRTYCTQGVGGGVRRGGGKQGRTDMIGRKKKSENGKKWQKRRPVTSLTSHVRNVKNPLECQNNSTR